MLDNGFVAIVKNVPNVKGYVGVLQIVGSMMTCVSEEGTIFNRAMIPTIKVVEPVVPAVYTAETKEDEWNEQKKMLTEGMTE